MTNAQIVFNEALAQGIYTEEEAVEYLEKIGCLPLFTFQVWKQNGYHVKRGQHARLTTRIWKPRTKKSQPDETSNEICEGDNGYFLHKVSLFAPDQVEKDKQILNNQHDISTAA